MKKRKNKRKVSKITLILIAFVWMIAIVFTLMFMLNTIKKSNKLKAMKKDRKINENKIMKRLIKVRNTGSGI